VARALVLLAALAWLAAADAKDAVPAAADPALEARVMALSAELRCLVCQNQTIADSHADLAVDLRDQVREKMRQGMSDAQIIDFMVERYGDFVLYRPPLNRSTLALWFGPGLLMFAGVMTLAIVLRRVPRDESPPDDA